MTISELKQLELQTLNRFCDTWLKVKIEPLHERLLLHLEQNHYVTEKEAWQGFSKQYNIQYKDTYELVARQRALAEKNYKEKWSKINKLLSQHDYSTAITLPLKMYLNQLLTNLNIQLEQQYYELLVDPLQDLSFNEQHFQVFDDLLKLQPGESIQLDKTLATLRCAIFVTVDDIVEKEVGKLGSLDHGDLLAKITKEHPEVLEGNEKEMNMYGDFGDVTLIRKENDSPKFLNIFNGEDRESEVTKGMDKPHFVKIAFGYIFTKDGKSIAIIRSARNYTINDIVNLIDANNYEGIFITDDGPLRGESADSIVGDFVYRYAHKKRLVKTITLKRIK